MKLIESRLYTNVALTAIAILLAVLAIRPYASVSTLAQAQNDERPSLIKKKATSDLAEQRQYGQVGDLEVAAATKYVAESNREIADAIRESGKATADAIEAMALAMTQGGDEQK